MPSRQTLSRSRYAGLFPALFVVLMLASSAVFSGEIAAQRSWYADLSGSMSFSEVQREAFEPYEHILSRGFRSPDEILWIRLDISPEKNGRTDTLALRIRPPMLDSLRLYDPQGGVFGGQAQGDKHAANIENYFSPNYTFFINDVDAARTLWLRLDTASPQIISVEVFSLPELIKTDSKQQLVFFTYLAIEVFLILWGFSQWLGLRDQVLLTFVIKQLILSFYALGNMGYLHFFWSAGLPGSTDFFFKVIIIASIAISFHFEYIFFREFKPNRFLHNLLLIGSLMFPVQFLLLFAGLDQYMARMNIILAMLVPVISLFTAISSRSYVLESGQVLISKRLLVVVYTLLAVIFFSTALNLLGVIDPVPLTFNGFLSYAFLWGLIFILILNKRMNLIREENQRLLISIEKAEQHADFEKQARLEKNHFLEMLTHELKTPLSVVQMVLGSKNIDGEMKHEAQNSIYEMSRVLSYVHQVEKMDEKYIDIHQEVTEINNLLSDAIDSVKAKNVDFIGGEDIFIKTDTHLLHTIVSNLLDNAMKYGSKDSVIKLSVSRRPPENPRSLVISISNLPGQAGWPDPQRIFQKYYRENASQHYTGSGLGLYLSAGLAKLINAKLSYQPTAMHVRFELMINLPTQK